MWKNSRDVFLVVHNLGHFGLEILTAIFTVIDFWQTDLEKPKTECFKIFLFLALLHKQTVIDLSK